MWVLTVGCKALLSVLLSTPSGLAYLVQQQEGSQSLINALQNRYAYMRLDIVALAAMLNAHLAYFAFVLYLLSGTRLQHGTSGHLFCRN